MRPSFLHGPVNSLFEDPLVYVNFVYEKRALLFDLGDFQSLTNRQINRLTHVFVTHMHIDHFIGFDRLLRVRLSCPDPLSLVGPPGILEAVKAKLSGYTWNLIEDYPCEIVVMETDGISVRKCSFSARNRFSMVEVEADSLKEPGIIVREDSFLVRAVLLDHGVQVLGFRLEEPCHVNILKDQLLKRGFQMGPWLKEFKDHIRTGRLNNTVDTGQGTYYVNQILDLVKITQGQKIAYVMDVRPDEENIQKIVELVSGVDTLYIEAFFKSDETERAYKRHHLTASVAGTIAKRASVKEICPLHVSAKYRDDPSGVFQELAEASGFRPLRCQ